MHETQMQTRQTIIKDNGLRKKHLKSL